MIHTAAKPSQMGGSQYKIGDKVWLSTKDVSEPPLM